MYRTGIITLSDRGALGLREDVSGRTVRDMLPSGQYEIAAQALLPDDPELLKAELIRQCGEEGCDLILTTGGTGLSARDITPEATLAVADRSVPGIAEALRQNGMRYTKRAMFGRGASVVRGRTLIVNLPGSPKAVRESLEFLLPELSHGLDILLGRDRDCGGEEDCGRGRNCGRDGVE